MKHPFKVASVGDSLTYGLSLENREQDYYLKRLIFNYLYHMINRFFCKHYIEKAYPEIPDGEYLDIDGKAHMDTYMSFYDREIAMETEMNATGLADSFISAFYSAPLSSDERNWEKAHGPARYEGGLQSFEVKPGTKRIGIRAFSYNINLKEISLPEGLEIIDKEAFLFCSSLQQITIPSTVRLIGREAFDNKVEKLILLCNNPPKISTLGVDDKCLILIPNGARDVYQKAKRWKRYARQISEME